jgi:hypothetical protein
MSIARLLPGLLIVAGFLAASPAGAVPSGTYLPPIGGGGGTDFNGACRSNELLTGFQLRIINGPQGANVPGWGYTSFGGSGYLDATRPVCAVASAADRVAAPALVSSWGRVAAGEDEGWRKAGFFGGALTVSNNVQMVNRLCPAEQPVVTGIKVNFGKNQGFTVVFDIRPTCGLASTQQAITTVRARTGQQAPSQSAEEVALYGTARSQSCPRGQVAIGAHGRAGALVDAVGLVCGAPRVVPDHAPPVIAVRNAVTSANTIARSAGIAAPARPAALPIDEAHPAIIYGIGADGVLRWYRHNGATTGAGVGVPGSWAGAKNVSGDWGSYKQVFTGGNGVIYGIRQDGKLIWSRHVGLLTGQGSDEPGAWEEPREVSSDFGQYRKVFSAGDGVIYAIAEDGQLLWFRHVGFGDGTPGWEGPVPVASGWADYELVFSGGRGVIYAAGADGILKWNKHVGFETGAAEWQGPKDVGRGWNGLRTAFSAGGGIIYSIAPDGILRWYRHNGYLDGAGLESAGSWEARTDVGRGWNSFANVIAQF